MPADGTVTVLLGNGMGGFYPGHGHARFFGDSEFQCPGDRGFQRRWHSGSRRGESGINGGLAVLLGNGSGGFTLASVQSVRDGDA